MRLGIYLILRKLKGRKIITNNMSAPQAKILSQAPTELELQVAQAFVELELQVAQAFVELENSSPELKAELRPLQFKSIREVCY